MSLNILPEIMEQIFTKRVRCDYDLNTQHIMKLQKENVLNDLEILKLTGKLVIYENQEKIGLEVVTRFDNDKIINIMVLSKTQSGKTGSMCATIKQYLNKPNNQIPIENIYIITGLSSCEWKEQTIERMPNNIQSRVFHGCQLPITFANEIKEKKNILIIMDEIQVAAKKGQTIYKTFMNAGLLNKSKLYENDVKILEYTATPDGTIYDLMKWNDASCKILANPGQGYTGAFDLLRSGRIKQFKELCGYNKETGIVKDEIFENIKEIKCDIDNYTNPLYHIIRTRNGIDQNITIENFKTIFGIINYNYINYDRESEIKDINKTIQIKPEKHTLIFIKDMLRCAKTIVKEYIGILYDRYTNNPDDATIIQGLVGRDTGYDNNGQSICYTNPNSIERYEELWNSNFEDKTIRWNSKTTKYTNGILSGKNTFNDPEDYDGFSVYSDESDEIKEPVIKKFKTQEEAKEYYINELKKTMKGNGPNIRKSNNDGYFEATIRSIKKIYSCDEILFDKKYGLNEKNKYRFYPCYKDITNKSTLEWWLIHY